MEIEWGKLKESVKGCHWIDRVTQGPRNQQHRVIADGLISFSPPDQNTETQGGVGLGNITTAGVPRQVKCRGRWWGQVALPEHGKKMSGRPVWRGPVVLEKG